MKPRLVLLALALTSGLLAQPSATMRPGLLSSLEAGWSWSSKEDLSRGPARVGEVAVQRYSLSVSGRSSLNAETGLLYGLAYTTNRLDASAGILPDELSEFSFNLGLTRQFSPAWSGAAYLRPGFYGDFDDLDGDSFNTPVLATLAYSPARELTWLFGLNVNAFSDNPVLPILGVRWQFAPDWTFNVGFPRSGFTWKYSEQLSLQTGVAFQGGSFRVGRDPRASSLILPPAPSLSDTYLDYREVRVGLSADYALTETLKISLEAGAVTDRKFDWFDRNYRLDGDAGTYLGFSIRGSF